MSIPSDQDASGRSFGVSELANLRRVLDSGTLFGPKGTFVKRLEADFAAWNGSRHAIAASSGTGAIHTALASLALGPGDEVITTPITDIGALTPILYQGAVPVFCDVDPLSGNVTAASVRERFGDRTKAVVVTHLFGNPADMPGISSLASEADVPVLEDCAQAFGATIAGSKVGGFGSAGVFSLQQGKHITSGEGGIAVTDSDDLARHMRLFVNKAWDYDQPGDHDFLALNYRMSELQAAVVVAQLHRLDENVASRQQNAKLLAGLIEDLPGVELTRTLDETESSFWRVGLLIDPEVVPGGSDALAFELRSVGVPAASRYIKKPAFQTGLFAEQRTLGESRWPFTLAAPDALDYSPDRYPGVFGFLGTILVVPWNERLTADHVERIGEAIASGVEALRGRAS